MRARLAIILLCLSILASAQESRDSYRSEVSIAAGVYAPLTENKGSDLLLSLSYGYFSYNGLGYTAGIQYIPSVVNVNDVLGFPIAFAFRSGDKNAADRFESAAGNAARSARMSGSDNQEILKSALLGLFNQAQFSLGITPGYIIGGSSSVGYSRIGQLTREEFWTERKSPLFLSLDAGISFNLNIWRFDLKLQPAVHYWLTNSLIPHSSVVDEISGPLSDKASPARWFFSFSGGLSFRF
ncbi:MAG: hypothetical protein II019_05705 [Bacteroidales bacterium]|nr:hypothetical protein [Bacteroidales bacterium]